jgi:hypothetical protein
VFLSKKLKQINFTFDILKLSNKRIHFVYSFHIPINIFMPLLVIVLNRIGHKTHLVN